MRDFGLNKDVVVEVKGTQSVGDMSDTLEVITPGTYNYKNGTCYVMYHEYPEDAKEPVKTMLKITDDKIEMIKRGEYNVNMVFGDGSENLAYYNTPFGQLLIGIVTKSMKIEGEDNRVKISIEYMLTMNGEYASDNEIEIVVRS